MNNNFLEITLYLDKDELNVFYKNFNNKSLLIDDIFNNYNITNIILKSFKKIKINKILTSKYLNNNINYTIDFKNNIITTIINTSADININDYNDILLNVEIFKKLFTVLFNYKTVILDHLNHLYN